MSDIGVQVDRVQWGVGNGGFHTEDVWVLPPAPSPRDPVLRIVYDCGTLRPRTLLQGEVRAWCLASRVAAAPDCTDVLILSHFDRDHVNGLPLLDGEGFRPDVVILPYLPVGARVIQLLANIAASADTDGGEPVDDDTFADELVVDPHRAIGELWRGVPIIEVGDPESGPEGPEVRVEDPRAGTTVRWDRGGVEVSLPGGPLGPPVCVLWECEWAELRPPKSPDLPVHLRDALADLLDLTPEEVGSPATLWQAISVKGVTAQVAKLYKSFLGRNLNPYSVVLWSGPGDSAKRVTASRGPTIRGATPQRDAPVPPWTRSGGWLGTGDAVLRTAADVQGLLDVLARPLGEVDVVNAPHHGSKNNSGQELYARVPGRPGLVLMNADGMGRYSHPHADVVGAALKHGHAVVRVGNSDRERIMWGVSVRP